MVENEKNKLDLLAYTHSVLKRLGCGDVDTFEKRLRSQKIQYFAQLFGVSFRYRYNLYLHGPYSTDLARDLYQIKTLKIKADTEKFIPNKLEDRFIDLKKFIKDKTTRRLELAATLHWFLKVVELSQEDSRQKLVEIKKATTEELVMAFSDIKEYEKIKKDNN